MSTPFTPPAFWLSGTNQNSIPANDNALRFWISQADVDDTTTAQPASPVEGQCHIIQATHTGAQWASFTPNDLAIFSGGTWYAFAPVEGNKVTVGGAIYVFISGAWADAGGGGSTAWGDLTDVPQPILDIGALTDPDADRLLFWDDSAGVYTHLALGTNLSITGTTLNASDGGSGGPTGFTAALHTTGTNEGLNASSLTASGGTSDQDAVFAAAGTGSILASIPDGFASGGNKRGYNAVDFQMSRSSGTQVAQGDRSALIGGRQNRNSGNDSFIGAGFGNFANASESAICGGQANTITSGGTTAFVGGGKGHTVSGLGSAVIGGEAGDTRGIRASVVQSSFAVDYAGDVQCARLVVARLTTDATPVGLSSNGNAPTSSSTPTLPDASSFGFTATITARAQTSGVSARYRIEGLIKRGANAASTAFVGTPVITAIATDSGASAWAVAAIANTTLGGLEIQVTGAASTFIKWTCMLQTEEVVGL